MVDTGTLRHAGGTTGEFDPDAVQSPFTPLPPYYDGPCRIRVDASVAREALVAEQEVTVRAYVVKLPISVVEARVGDIFTYAGPGDPMLVGRDMRVADVQGSSYAAERRLLCTLDLTDEEDE